MKRSLSRRVKLKTPIIKHIRRFRRGTAVTPKANVFQAPADNEREGLVVIVENEGIASLPNVPGDGGVDRRGREVSA
jgi:hypothetical protein